MEEWKEEKFTEEKLTEDESNEQLILWVDCDQNINASALVIRGSEYKLITFNQTQKCLDFVTRCNFQIHAVITSTMRNNTKNGFQMIDEIRNNSKYKSCIFAVISNSATKIECSRYKIPLLFHCRNQLQKQLLEIIGINRMTKKIFAKPDKMSQKIVDALNYVTNNIENVNIEQFYEAQKCILIFTENILTKNSNALNDETLNNFDLLKNENDRNKYKKYMNPKFDKNYNDTINIWNGPINDCHDRGKNEFSNYYCPVGWNKYGVNIRDFDNKYSGWHIAYHGAPISCIASILLYGLIPTKYGEWYSKTNHGYGIKRIYFTPSIQYSGYCSLARPYKLVNGKYIQMVLQVRIKPGSFEVQKETGGVDNKCIIDQNYSNDKLEYIIDCTDGNYANKYVICGIMVRISDDPSKLKESAWWTQTWVTRHVDQVNPWK